MFNNLPLKAISHFIQVRCNKRTQPNHYRNLVIKGIVSLSIKSMFLSAGTSILPLALTGIAACMGINILAGLVDQDGIFEQYLTNGISSSVGLLVGIIC